METKKVKFPTQKDIASAYRIRPIGRVAVDHPINVRTDTLEMPPSFFRLIGKFIREKVVKMLS